MLVKKSKTMKILGIILVIIGGVWIFSRLLNQPVMFRIIKDKINENGLFFGIRRYLSGELFGFGLGIGIMGIGIYLLNTEFLYFYILGVGILLSTVFLWGSFELYALPRALIIIFGIWGLVFWGIVGLILGILIGWIITMVIGTSSLVLFGNLLNRYEYTDEAGKKVVLTLGYEGKGKFDIYWDDIIASKNNIDKIILNNGDTLETPDFDPEEAKDFINTKCPFCSGNVNRFFYISDEKRESDYTAWMEVCWKCKRVLYLDTNIID